MKWTYELQKMYPKFNIMKKINPIWYVLIVAFSIRLLLPIIAYNTATGDITIFHPADTDRYIKTAEELITTGKFTYYGIPELPRTPGYPILLMPGILLNSLEMVTILIQVFLSCLTIYIVFRISLLLFENTRIATLCASLYAIEPLSIVFSGLLLTETLFTFLNTLFLYYMVKYLKRGQIRNIILSAVTLSASVYVRPINYFLPVFVASILFIWTLTEVQKRKVLLVHIFSFFLISMVLIALWQIRNKSETGYSGFSAIVDHNLYFYDGASVLSAKQGIPFSVAQENMGIASWETYLEIHPEQTSWSVARRYEYMRGEGLKIILDNLYTYFKIRIKATFKVLFGTGAKYWLQLFKYPHRIDAGIKFEPGFSKNIIKLIKKDPIQVFSRLGIGMVLILYLLLGAAGFFSRDCMYRISTIMIFCVGIYLLFISGGGGAGGRFRHPIMPIVSIFAGYGLFISINKLKTRKHLKKLP